ncbi:alpha/beta fold hydrolase [Streptomyces sp. CBMA156]|uniref:alpha/beta fold hydrolase n=1 Tax=Streptomyces sp. CBMA156 TaxID=1930280 RepID=UPI001661CBB3|nr:alpha/beta hydrolase [Streptomyces sp. CBMA156]MBD0670427.1 hypothetical protein [Streptomyces sp. CBMA156]MBD0675208.1 hypothetical protein [Streptomyces sp. CBMA156]
MAASQENLTGDFTEVWNASAQPALLLRAARSFLLSPATARRMASERANTRLVEVPDCGHWIPTDAPGALARHVGAFLDGLPPAP